MSKLLLTIVLSLMVNQRADAALPIPIVYFFYVYGGTASVVLGALSSGVSGSGSLIIRITRITGLLPNGASKAKQILVVSSIALAARPGNSRRSITGSKANLKEAPKIPCTLFINEKHIPLSDSSPNAIHEALRGANHGNETLPIPIEAWNSQTQHLAVTLLNESIGNACEVP